MRTYLNEIHPGSHIYVSDNSLPLEVCQEIIARFEDHPEKTLGITTGGFLSDMKLSTDLYITGREDWVDLDKKIYSYLTLAFQEFLEKSLSYEADIGDEGYNIQRTDPGGFYKPHFDQDDARPFRILSAVLYLNDVTIGGETSFRFGSETIKVPPKAGRLCLFPPFWTHVHEGLPPVSGSKYIITTWLGWKPRGANL